MSGVLGAAFWFVVTLGVLVTFHEFGHFWVGRRFGVKVLKFSIGFGRPLWARVGADGTRYQVAMIPLGGYVQFLDERETEVTPAERDRAFNRQHVLKRIAIIAAGPFANFVLCIALFWATYMIGWQGIAPVIGKAQGIAAAAGFQQGDRILAVDGVSTPSLNHALTPLALAAIDRKPVALTVKDIDGRILNRTLHLDRLPPDFNQADPLGAIGLALPSGDGPALVGLVQAGSAAEGALQPGDRILSVGGTRVSRFADIPAALQKPPRPHRPVDVEFERHGRRLRESLVPRQVQLGKETVWRLGIGLGSEPTLLKSGPVEALGLALAETGKQSREMLRFIASLVTGRASTKNISGVIGIAQVAQAEANLGASRLIWLMASLSLTLCIMNLLPIPVLDGGHLLYYLIELVSGRPVGERVLVAGQFVGLLMLAGLICLAFYNDIVRTIS